MNAPPTQSSTSPTSSFDDFYKQSAASAKTAAAAAGPAPGPAIAAAVTNPLKNVMPTTNTFSNMGLTMGSKEFMSSNALIVKIAFLLLILAGFMVCLRLGMAILAYFLNTSNHPKLINGMVDGKQLLVIPQNPAVSGAKVVPRSTNQSDGIEFTWSVWIFIEDMTYNEGQYRCVFYKGNDFSASPNENSVGLNFPNNAPGVYLDPHKNNLVILMNTFSTINERMVVPDVPIGKWMNLILRCENTTLDIYMNGTIVKSHTLNGVPRQNYGNVIVGASGGFSGYVSNLWYYNTALDIATIAGLVMSGPSLTMQTSGAMQLKNPNYLSLQWYAKGGVV